MATDPSNNDDPTGATGDAESETPHEPTAAPRSQTTADAETAADEAGMAPEGAPATTSFAKDGKDGKGGADRDGTGAAGVGEPELISSHDEDLLDADGLDGGAVPYAASGAADRGGFAAGAAAIVSAGLGLSSLTGTSLGEMLRSRKELIGQIESSTGGGGGAGDDQIDAFYSAPWHTAALLNGIFAATAVIIGGVVLGMLVKRAETRSWVKAVALGGVILGVLGLLVSLGMYFDLFASTPELPDTPQQPPQPQG
ncbi:hypothetical protein [Streptomyces sp. NPDC054784]